MDVLPITTVPMFKSKTLNDQIRKNSKLSAFQNQLLKKLDAGQTSEDDPDRMFLLSMLPEYKELDKEEKLDFKLTMLQFFRGVRQKHVLHSQMPSRTQYNFSMHNQQQQHYNSQTSNQYQHSRTIYPSSSQAFTYIVHSFYLSRLIDESNAHFSNVLL
ncbi:hypothetical protein FQR65_LT12319 [Abscondita terminalis]|nr:hypothetical protein FQR65_LT12319 [Abscondita terminalis]